jgi:hypothetical protein
MKIVKELSASKAQLLRRRVSMGFPLKALLNQAIIYGSEQATVNYIIPPSDEWLEFGYSKLIGTDGQRSFVMRKDRIIVQMAATTRALEDTIIELLQPDPLQMYKIRTHRLPREWKPTSERFVSGEERSNLEHAAGGRITQALVQEFIVNREEIAIRYYHCETPHMAEDVAKYLARKKTSLIKRLVKLSGSIIVVADSQSPYLNERATDFVNW